MTDRIRGFYVALEEDIRSDDVEPLIEAVKCLRGVLKVEPKITSYSDWIAEERARRDLAEKLWAVLYPKDSDKKDK